MRLTTCESRRHYLSYYSVCEYIYIKAHNLSFILGWQRPLQMVSLKSHNINANEDFVILLTSNLITCFIDTFTSGMKSQSIASLLSESRERERESAGPWRWRALNMGFVDKWPSKMQGQLLLEVGWGEIFFSGRFRKPQVPSRDCPYPNLLPPKSS